MGGDGTVTLRDDGPRRGDRTEPALVLVMNVARPLEGPIRVPLAEVDEVVVGRGPVRRVVEDGPRTLRVDLADEAASTTHARIRRTGRVFVITDERSKNGTLVNGRRVERSELGAEDVIEVGNHFFMLRRDGVEAGDGPAALRTVSAPLAQRFRLFLRVARSTVPILIVGETGTGKELLAAAAHEASGRSGPFVAVNCGAIPEGLIQSELFGARKGAYSGAHADRTGFVLSAHGGTLFLDEVAELPEASQASLLRVLQEREVVALGSTKPVLVDVRILAATHQDLAARVAGGRFRDDLYARLRGHVLHLPPLRERRADLGLVLGELLRRAAGPRAPQIVLARAAARALLAHEWRHNIRELEQALTRAIALLDGDEIGLEHLPDEIASHAESPAGADDRKLRLEQLLRAHAGNTTAVARVMNTSRSQVKRLIARHGIDVEAYRGGAAVEDDDELG